MAIQYSPPAGASIVNGGNWVAIKDADGSTYYESANGTGSNATPIAGASKYTGPIIISAGNLTIDSGAVASGVYVSGIKSIYILSGGILENSTNVNGYTYISNGGLSSDNILVSDNGVVSSGGTSVNDLIISGLSGDGGGDTFRVNSGGSVDGATISGTNMILLVSQGGYIAGNTLVDSGGILRAQKGSVINSPVDVQSGGTLSAISPLTTIGTGSGASTYAAPDSASVVRGGNWVAIKDADGSTYYESATGGGSNATPLAGAIKYTGPIIISGGNLTVDSGAVASGAYLSGSVPRVYIQSGGTFEKSINVNGYTFVSSGGLSSDNILVSDRGVVSSGGTSVHDSIIAGISGDGGVDTFTVSGGGTLVSAYVGSGNTLNILSGGQAISSTIVAGANYYVVGGVSDGSDSCFLAGSLIKTPDGLAEVEDLRIGDEIITYVDGVETIRHVTWAGRSQCNVRRHLLPDQAGYPVRILKNAISDNVPFKDMLITAEHCLFFNGRFIPARMLVNNRSVFYDMSITSYDYYHIETADHSVIMADGVLTESYLDTGNRYFFNRQESVVSIRGSHNLAWETDAAAPLAVSRDEVEPIFRLIEARSIRNASPLQTKKVGYLTYERNLHLVTDAGRAIYQVREHNGYVMFMIPSDIKEVRIVSNASRPCDVAGPFIDDRRTLGVLIGEVIFIEGEKTTTLTSHLKETTLTGWSNVEDGNVRWTSGNALLPLPPRPGLAITLMAIRIHAGGPYLLPDDRSECLSLSC